MKRLPNWEFLLAAHFAKAARTPFAWGTFDCALAACDGIASITGVDPASAYRGQYHSAAGALAITGNDLGAFAAGICATLGFPEVRPSFARRGDLAMVKVSDPQGALGTVDLSGRFAWAASARGFIRVPMKFWIRAWRIG